MSAAALLQGDLCAAAEALRQGRVTAVELTTASLEALAAHGSALNAAVELWDDAALAAAARIDAERQGGAALGVLAGVPLAHKDMFYRAGKRCASGSGHFICPFNYLGLPALTLPIGRTQNGLPMAIQLVGPPFAEAQLLRLAHQLERAAGFRLGPPPLPQ